MPPSRGKPVPASGPQKPLRDVPVLSRVVLFFTPLRRKVLGFAGLVATWLLSALFPDAGPWHPVLLLRDAAGIAVGTCVALLAARQFRKPLPLPQQQMLGLARERYAKEDSWVSPRHPEQVLDAVARAFDSPGTSATRIADSVLVEMDRRFHPTHGQGQWRHADAAQHLKFRPAVLVFAAAGPGGTGSLVRAFSQDNQHTGMYDVLSLADEMAAAAVEVVRAAAGDDVGPGRGAAPGSRPHG